MSEVVAAVAFDATVMTPTRGPGAHVVLPGEAATIFGTRARVPVRATFNGVAYRGSAMPMGDGLFCLGLTRAIRKEYVVWVTSAKKTETRADRLAKAVTMVREGEALS